jgi:hypothetical protein
MPGLKERCEKWLRLAGIGLDPFESAVRKAHFALNRIAGKATIVPDDISQPILQASDAVRAGQSRPDIEQAFYRAYSRLTKLAPHKNLDDDDEPGNPFEDALDDSELLLKFAAETGVDVPKEVIEPILTAHTAYKAGEINNAIMAGFYDAYGRLAKLFGDVTADSIRNCSSAKTRQTLYRNRICAVSLTFAIAAFSVVTFVADSMSKGILEDIATANNSAATLRAALTPNGGTGTIDAAYAKGDPCDMLGTPSSGSTPTVQNLSDVEQLQEFAATIRNLLGRGVKLNWVVAHWECNPFAACGVLEHDTHLPAPDNLNNQLQLNPALVNYTAEVLCKIRTYQIVRTFASNVQMDYAAIVGAFASYALPIVYALLGAYAFRLRLFSETIRKRTYHPSFSDSARMITAVIAGAIAGLFNPAQGLALSPLATAFLVGYGVELFFKFLDTLINAFGSPPVAGHRS